jgi:hypothetical protein
MSEGPEWFAPKRYGYGAGLPISWQGWALTAAYVLCLAGVIVPLRNRRAEMIAASVLPTVAFILITAKTTRGGWRWRRGKED